MKTLILRFGICPVLWFASLVTAFAQPTGGAATNAPAIQAAVTQPKAWLTFGLDRIEWLGNPLWQYIASLHDTTAEKTERAIAIIEEIFKPHPKTADLIISFNKFNDSSLNILVVHWWNSTDFKEYLLGFQKLNLELKRRFDAEGIDFAFPTQTVYVKNGAQSGAPTDAVPASARIAS